ncbi:MAG: prepilin-type N-terminal cleavage/methylation domain-containing protein, partial [Acidimicrobiales bacterium]
MKSAKNPKKSHRWSLNPSTARARARARARGQKTDEGITLVEVLVAFTILMITMVPVGYLLDSTVAAANNARQKEAALQLADSWLEILSNSSPPQSNGIVTTNSWTTPIAPAGAQSPVSQTTDGTTFVVQAEYSWQSVANETGQSSDLCSDGEPPSPSHPGVIQLHVKVSWNGDKTGDAVTDTTNVDYPQPGLQTEGYISLQLTNSGVADTNGNTASNRLQAIPVEIQPVGGTAYPDLYPDDNGCFFAELPQGQYVISLGQPTAGTPAAFTGYTGSPPFVTTS